MSDPQSAVQEAQALVDAGAPTEAVKLLVAWTSAHADDAAAWEILAKIHFDLGHWGPARMAAAQVTRLRPGSAVAWCNVGTILRKMGKPKEAGEAQLHALQLDPHLRRAHVEVAKLRKQAEAQPPAEATDEVRQEFPPADAAPGFENPYYCRQCRRKIPKAVSDGNDGLCGPCLREQLAPSEQRERPSLLAGIPMWALGAALAVVLVFGTTCGLMIGRHGNGARPAPPTTDQNAAASGETSAPARSSQRDPITPSVHRGQPSNQSAPGAARRAAPSPTMPPARSDWPPARSASNGAPTPPPEPPTSGVSAQAPAGYGGIRGTVTFYFNDNYRDKPDSGTKVYMIAGNIQECPLTWIFLGGSTEVIYSPPSNQSGATYRLPISAHTIADGNGNFSIDKLPVGYYTVILQSAHTKDLNQRDCQGRKTYKHVGVAADNTVDVSEDFGVSGI